MTRISPTQLVAQVQAAQARWPALDTIEAAQALPRWLLYAVGSRETNLTDETGDGGHGHGIFQLDDRYHTIPQPFPVELQAATAAAQLRQLILLFGGQVMPAVCAYNAGAGAVTKAIRDGKDPNTVTAGGDYGTDVLWRCSMLQRSIQPPPDPQEAVTVLNKPACAIVVTPDGAGYWIIAEDGGVFTYGDAPFLGSEAAKPLNAPVTDAACHPDGQTLWLLAADGGVFTEGQNRFYGSAAGGG